MILRSGWQEQASEAISGWYGPEMIRHELDYFVQMQLFSCIIAAQRSLLLQLSSHRWFGEVLITCQALIFIKWHMRRSILDPALVYVLNLDEQLGENIR